MTPTEPGFYWAHLRSTGPEIVRVEFIEREPDELLDAAFPGRCRQIRIFVTGSEIDAAEEDIAHWGPRVAEWEPST